MLANGLTTFKDSVLLVQLCNLSVIYRLQRAN